MTRTRPSVWHTLGRAAGMVAALPARAVGVRVTDIRRALDGEAGS